MIHRYGLISDTHGHLHPALFLVFSRVEAIFHAGDVVDEDHLDELDNLAPVHAVMGNCDTPSARLPLMRVVEMPFGKVGLVHGHTVDTLHDPRAIVAKFGSHELRLVLYGHTHRMKRDFVAGTWVINPGSAGKPRFRDTSSLMILTWDDETNVLDFETIALDWTNPKAGSA